MPITKKNGNGNSTTFTIAGKKYTIHPSAKMVPAMREDEFDALKADIKDNGVRQRILVRSGTIILDGIHRARAVAELEKEGVKKPLPTEPYGGSEGKINSEIVSRNAHRRHLTNDQRLTLIAWSRVPELKEAAKQRMTKGKEAAEAEPKGEASTIIAAEAESGQVRARHAIDIVTQLPESDTKKVISGKMKFMDAAREARKRRLKATGKSPVREPKKVDKLAPEYIHKRFGLFLKHWTHEQHRAVRKVVREYLK